MPAQDRHVRLQLLWRQQFAIHRLGTLVGDSGTIELDLDRFEALRMPWQVDEQGPGHIKKTTRFMSNSPVLSSISMKALFLVKPGHEVPSKERGSAARRSRAGNAPLDSIASLESHAKLPESTDEVLL